MDNFAKTQEFPKQEGVAEGLPFAVVPVSVNTTRRRYDPLRSLIGVSAFKVTVMGCMPSSPKDAAVRNPGTYEWGLIWKQGFCR